MTEGAKKPFDFAEAFCKKVPCNTSEALVYARPLASGRWSTVSASDDPATVGEAAIRVLTGPQEKAGDETPLAKDLFDRLLPADIQNLAHAVAKVNRLGELRADATPYESLGELILLKRQESRNEVQRLIDQARTATLLGPAFTSITTQPELHTPDFRNTPMNRAAEASEEAAAQIKAGLLLWEQQQEADKQAAAESKAQSEANLAVARSSLKTARLTMWLTVLLAVMSSLVQCVQNSGAERVAAEDRAKQAEIENQRHEATLWVLKELLAAQQQVLTQLAKKAAPEQKKQTTATSGAKPN